MKYCTKKFAKSKAFFQNPGEPFHKSANGREKPAQKPPCRAEQTVEQPQQRFAQRQEPERRAEQRPRAEKEAKLPAPDVERLEQQRGERGEEKQRVERERQRPDRAPEGAQNVVKRGQSQPARHGERKLRRLHRDRLLHQRSSRARKPPPGASSS